MNTAAYIHGAGDIRIEPFMPAASAGVAINVNVAAVGICGSDLHYYKDGGIGSAVIAEPFVPGHEFSGYLSADIELLGLKKGQLVAVDPATPCHTCEWCKKAHHNLCPNVAFFGAPPLHGALTQLISVPTENVMALPDGMTADQGAMLEPLGVCLHVLDLAKPRLCESVAVLGCGPIGLGILQLLRLSNCGDIIAVDPQPHRIGLALKLGATAVGETYEAVLENTAGLGCDLVIEATNSPAGFRHSIVTSKIGARVVLAGIPDGDLYDPLSASEARRRGLTVKFSRRMGNVYPRAIELVHTGKVDVDILVSHRFNLEQTGEAFALQADEEVGLTKSMVYPNGQ